MINFNRYFIVFIAGFLLLLHPVSGVSSDKGKEVIERVYLTTDRDSYIAGEQIWISAFCFDISRGNILSELSSILYIELHNSDALVATAKIALINGRGAGSLSLTPTLPTGSYKIVAYTRYMLNEAQPVPFEKHFPLFNVLSSEKVQGNVEIGEAHGVTSPAIRDRSLSLSMLGVSNDVEIRFGQSGRVVSVNTPLPVSLINNSRNKILLSYSVSKVDSLPIFENKNITEYIIPQNVDDIVLGDKYIPEYEGEIIKGEVTINGNGSMPGHQLFFSAVGGESNVYTTRIDSAGTFTIFTSPIYGEREVVIEIPSADSAKTVNYRLFDPFVNFKTDNFPSLYINANMRESLTERGVEMQTARRFGQDTLFELLTVIKDPLLRTKPIIYHLDNYTRFPLMSDVVLEYIYELRFRRFDSKRDLQVRWEDGFKSLNYSRENTLVLLDGIPVFDHSRIFDYDPLKVKSISIYGARFCIGQISFDGIVSFKTYKGDYQGLKLGSSARIVDYQGVLHPLRYTSKEVDKLTNFPDLRTLLYWDPLIELKQGEKSEMIIQTSSNPGRYIIKVEGVSSDGIPVEYSTEFVVK